MSDILNSESPESVKGRANIIAAWDNVQYKLDTQREEITAAQNFFFPLMGLCEIQIGPEILRYFPPSAGFGNCRPHFFDLGWIIASMTDYALQSTRRTFIVTGERRRGLRSDIKEITCEDACLNLNPTNCEILDSPSIEDVTFRVIGFAAALSFVITFFDGYVLIEYLKRKHDVNFLIERADGTFLEGKVLVK